MLRIDRTQRGAALERHLTGDTRPTTARPREGIPPVEFLDADGKVIDRAASDAGAQEAMKYAAACRRVGKRTRGRKAEPVVQFLIAGMPRFGDDAGWKSMNGDVRVPPVRLKLGCSRQYHRAALDWLLKCAGPGSRLVRAVIHNDEAAPHMHVQIIAADEQQRLGWNRIRGGFASAAVGRGEHARGLAEMQDRFHAEVASVFRLERGGDVSGAARTAKGRRHEAVDRERGLELRLDEERAAREGPPAPGGGPAAPGGGADPRAATGEAPGRPRAGAVNLLPGKCVESVFYAPPSSGGGVDLTRVSLATGADDPSPPDPVFAAPLCSSAASALVAWAADGAAVQGEAVDRHQQRGVRAGRRRRETAPT